MIISAKNELLKYSGRIDHSSSEWARMIYASSFVKIKFIGNGISVEIENHNQYWTNFLGVIIDGVQNKVEISSEKGRKTYILAENLDFKEHELILFKRQDACHVLDIYSFEILGNDCEILPCTINNNRRIEVFGDSVSCGEVAEAVDYVGKSDPEHIGQYSNSWYSYGWILARMLGAEIHTTAQGGIALMDGTGYFCGPDYIGMESVYDKLQYKPQILETSEWDFDLYEPHLAIIAIGQNDSHPENFMADDYDGENSKLWRAKYEKFIRTLMEFYPRTHFILITTLLNHDAAWDRAIEDVKNSISNDRVHHYVFSRNGSATPGHPRISEAQEMADELYNYIEEIDDLWSF